MPGNINCIKCELLSTKLFIGVCNKCEYLWRIHNISIKTNDNSRNVYKRRS
jgi:hypothetical protein